MAKKLKTTTYKSADGIKRSGIHNILPISKKVRKDLTWVDKIIPRSKVRQLSKKLKAKKLRIVFTPGGFDMIHVGHARYLALGKSLGDVLVVGINSDKSIKIYKGTDRPILNQERRAEMLAHLAAVDYVVIFDDSVLSLQIKQLTKNKKDLAQNLAALAVDNRLKGDFFSVGVIKDLRPDRLLCIEETWEGKLHERPEVKAVLEYGGEVFCSPRQEPELSTSKIIMKLMEDGKRELLKDMSQLLNQNGSLEGAL